MKAIHESLSVSMLFFKERIGVHQKLAYDDPFHFIRGSLFKRQLET